MTLDEERAIAKRRDARNIALALALVGVAVLLYFVTIARMTH